MENTIGLVNVRVEVSGVIASPVSDAWEAVCASLGETDCCPPDEFRSHAQRPLSRRRAVKMMGSGRLHEELVLFDKDRHTLGTRPGLNKAIGDCLQGTAVPDVATWEYRLVTDEGNVNPFSGSFLNYHWVINLCPITLMNSTLMRVQGSFHTEPEWSASMLAVWEDVYRDMIEGISMLYQPGSHLPDMLPVRAAPLEGAVGLLSPETLGWVVQSLSAGEMGRTPSAHGITLSTRNFSAPPHMSARQSVAMLPCRRSATFPTQFLESIPSHAGSPCLQAPSPINAPEHDVPCVGSRSLLSHGGAPCFQAPSPIRALEGGVPLSQCLGSSLSLQPALHVPVSSGGGFVGEWRLPDNCFGGPFSSSPSASSPTL